MEDSVEAYKGGLYWPTVTDAVLRIKPSQEKRSYDVLVVGGGMSGVLSAYRLGKDGYRVLLVEKDRIGSGSTAASTGLIQYMSDLGIREFAEQIGKDKAEAFYDWSGRAIDTLQSINDDLKQFGPSPYFKATKSLIVSTKRRSRREIRKETKTQKQLGFDVDLKSKSDLRDLDLEGYNALEANPDIAMNPYGWVRQVANHAHHQFGVDIMENTELVSVEQRDNGVVDTMLKIAGKRVERTYPKVVLAAGYAPPKQILKKLRMLQTFKTFVIVSQQFPINVNLPKHLIWEKREPYTYIRRTFEPRIMIGGLDERGRRLRDKDASKNREKLIEAAGRLMKDAEKDIRAEFSYAALFGESKDNLPYMGPDPDMRNVFILCGLGGNGTVYSVIGSDIVVEWMEDQTLEDAELFRINR